MQAEVISLSDQLRGNEAAEMNVTLVKYIEEEVPMNEDWYMVGVVVDVLCELMLSLYFVDHANISWSMSWKLAQCHLANLIRLTNRLSPFGLSEELPVVNNSYTSINDDGKNLNN